MRLIAHISLHNFFITAILAGDPDLAGKPVAIIKKNRVIDASPEAVASGVCPGLTKRHALQANPLLACIEFRPDICREATAKLASNCYNFSPRIETIAENEVLIDLSGKTPPTVRVMQKLVKDLVPYLGSFATISLAPSRLLAKAATMTLLSPAGCAKAPALPGMAAKSFDSFRLCVVKGETAGTFASGLPLEMMWPLDNNAIKQLKSLGLTSFRDVSTIPLTMLHRQLGSLAPIAADYSSGIDMTNVPVFCPPDRIVFHRHCAGADRLQLEAVIKEAAIHIGRLLRERGQSYRELTLTVFFDDFRMVSKSVSHTGGRYDITSIYHTGITLLSKALTDNGPVTEISLAAGQFTANCHNQLTLFDDPRTLNRQSADQKLKLAAVCRNLAAKYSPGIITMGKAIPVSRREQMLMFVDPLRSKG